MKIIRLFISITILLSILASSAVVAAPSTPDSPDELGTLTRIGILESGTIHDLTVQGNYAYAGFGSTLLVIDITDPADMQRVASLPLAGEIQAIEADQGYLYVSSNGSGLWIIDIQNPLAPVKTGFYPSQSSSLLAVHGDFVYISMGNVLTIIDVSARDDPRFAGPVMDIILHDIAVKDDYLYVTGRDIYAVDNSGIKILDISNPIQPVYVGQYTPASQFGESQIEISNTTLYYAIAPYLDVDGFQVLDITTPTEPKLIGSLDNERYIHGLAISGDRVYFAFETCPEGFCSGGFEIIEVSDPSLPEKIGTYNVDSLEPTSIAASGESVFLTHTGEVQSIDASHPSAPILVDSLNSSLNAPNKIAIAGDYAYIIDFENWDSSRLRIADISNPYQPIETSQLSFPGTHSRLTDVEISGDLAIVTQATWPLGGMSSVYFIDVSDPQNPMEVGRFDDPTFAGQEGVFEGLGVQGDFAYACWYSKVLAGISGMYVLNISDPANPEQTSFFEIPGAGCRDVYLFGEYAYIPYDGLILDVSDPENPVKAGELSNSGSDFDLEGNIAYLASDPWVTLLDASNPVNLVEVSSFWIGGVTGIDVQDNYLFVSSGSGLSVLDVSQPITPTLAAFFPSMEGRDVSVQGKEIFFTSSEGLQILHITGTVSGVVRQPNRMPVPGVTITANGTFSDTTTSAGAYTFEGLEPGSYTIAPSLPGFTFTPQQVQVVVPPNEIVNFTLLPLPVSMELTPGITTTLTYTDFQDLPTSFIFPAGLVSSTATAYVTPTLATEPFGSAFTGHAFELALQAGGTSIYSTTFPVPVSVAIQYSPQDTAVISDTMMLALYRQDGAGWVKTEDTCSASPTPVPIEPGIFRTTICQSGRYALFGPTHAIALPQVPYGSDPSEVILP
jgi:hypothetical protein